MIIKRLGWLISLLFIVSSAHAVLRVEVTGGSSQATPIAIVPFKVNGPAVPAQPATIISSDLARSGQFKPLPEQDMLTKPVMGQNINFDNWRLMKVDHMVVGDVSTDASGDYVFNFQLMDVNKGQQVYAQRLRAPANQYRMVVHHISDLIYEQITGEKGAFATRVAYVVNAPAGNGQRLYRLEVSDSDGENPRTIYKSSQPIMSPDWSPDGLRLAYVSFKNRKPEVWVHSVYAGERYAIAGFNGINGAPVWSPDGTHLALTLSRGGNPDVYIMNVKTRKLTQITRHWGIDTEPTFTPSGNALVFTSSASGNPQLYEQPLSRYQPAGKAQRLTFEGKYNTSPVISPDGRSIAFVQGGQGRYQIALFDRKTRTIQTLTDGRLDESPSFAPNGSMILYATKEQRNGVLAAVSVDGRTKQKLSSVDNSSVQEPVWGPYIN